MADVKKLTKELQRYLARTADENMASTWGRKTSKLLGMKVSHLLSSPKVTALAVVDRASTIAVDIRQRSANSLQQRPTELLKEG